MAFRHLSDFEHIQKNVAHYIRDGETPLYLLTEVIDNAADELLSGYADTIVVFLNYRDQVYAVADNGRGIPIKQRDMEYDIPIEICTSLRTGGKFDNDLYSQKAGLHGEGLTIVNALSSRMSITTKVKDGLYYEYVFFGSDDKNIKPKIHNKKFNFSTKISFWPNQEYFESLDIDRNVVIERCKGILVSSENATVLVQIINEDGTVENIKVNNDILNKFSDKVNGEYFTETIYGVRESDGKKIKDSCTVYVGKVPDTTSFVFRGVVNTLPMDLGNHYQFFRKAFNTYLYEKAKKDGMYVDEDSMVVGIHMLCIAKLSDPSFTGQQKYTLAGGLNRYSYIFDQDKVNAILDKHPEFVKQQLEIAQNVKMNKDAKKIEVKKSKTKVNVESLRDCSSKKLEERELYIVEGQSAGGTLLKGRDIKRHAVLPLRGKILNVLNSSMDKIIDSKTLGAIFNTIGIKPNDNNLGGLRYNKIIILCFTGDTRIKMLDGSAKTFEELAQIEKEHPGQTYWVYSVDKDGNVVPGKAVRPRMTRSTNVIAEVTIDNGAVIRCTPDHKFIMRNGSKVEAKDLKPGDSLMPLYFKEGDLYRDGIHHYMMVKSNDTGRFKHVHRLVAEAIYPEEYSKPDTVVHHIDRNIYNNSPENLQIMNKYEHGKMHLTEYNISDKHKERVKQLHKEGYYADTYQNLVEYNYSQKHKDDIQKYLEEHPEKREKSSKHMTEYNKSEKHIEIVKKMNSNEEIKILQAKGKVIKSLAYMISNNVELTPENYKLNMLRGSVLYEDIPTLFNNYEEAIEAAKEKMNTYDWSTYTKASDVTYNKNKKAKNSVAAVIKILLNAGLNVNEFNYEEHRRSKSDPKFKNITKYFKDLDEAVEYSKTYNHSVKAVKIVTLDNPIPMYNITVEEYHNYGILCTNSNQYDVYDSGLVVSNCDGDVDGAHISALLTTFFDKFARGLITAGKLFIGEMPLFSTKVKGKFVPLYTREAMEKHKSEGHPISRIKGLGEMNAEDLATCAFDEKNRSLIQVTESNSGEIDKIWKSRDKLVKDYIK